MAPPGLYAWGQVLRQLRRPFDWSPRGLLCKWWWKLEQEEGLWQDLVKAKYLSKASIHTVTHKLHDSPIWYDLLKIKEFYLRGGDIRIENGKKTRFWED